jgi:hypothetical protein
MVGEKVSMEVKEGQEKRFQWRLKRVREGVCGKGLLSLWSQNMRNISFVSHPLNIRNVFSF